MSSWNITTPSLVAKITWLGLLAGALLGCQSESAQSAPGVVEADTEHKSKEIPLVVGTYSTQGSKGIYTLAYQTVPGRFSSPELLAVADNPSYIHLDDERMYVVNELGEGQVTSYRVAPDGAVEVLAHAATQGASPCYVALSPDGRYLATANYMGGSISIFALDEQRAAQSDPIVLQHSGRGPNKDRQKAPHAHWVQWDPDKNLLYAVDLGIDQVRVYDFDTDSGQVLGERTALNLEPGDGPRHMFFHPQLPKVYVLNELSNTITVARQYPDGSLQSVQRISTLPEAFTEHSQAGHIYISADGRYLYASNRGHDSIVVYAIADDGTLQLKQHEPTGGKWPRHFAVLEDEGVLIVANQKSRNLVAFAVNDNGTLRATGANETVPQATFVGRR